uniref:Condensin complex subunit 1 n=1 Tax=Myripristis murdjan TaxID=586833 RepID=A0A667WNH5_9TELE
NTDMSWDFFVPVCVGDLVKTGGINQYVVQDVVSPKQLASHLNSFKAALRSQGPVCILEHFDTGYSVLQHSNTVDLSVKEDTLELLIQVVSGLAVSLPSFLQSTSVLAANRKEQLNAVKMSVFLLCKLTETLESCVCHLQGGKKGKAGEGLLQWDSERESVLQALVQLLQLDIRSLWSLSLVEEEFVSCVTCCCYKLLENPTISHVKSKPTRDGIIHLLGVLIKKYNHLLGASVKVIQLLQHFEQLSSVFAQAVSVWSTEYGVRAIIGEVIREIGQKSSEELAREGSGVKSFASFLSELSGLVPELMIPNISVLITHLEGESHNMRVAVCEVLGEILVRVLCGDGLDESGKADRDRFFDTLQEHLHDTHSHVRARVLQVYTRIVNSKALPLCRYSEVMELAVGRLMDKSVNVVKSAIQLLAAFIAHNPYSCKLSSADLKKPLEKETAKLKMMKERQEGEKPGRYKTFSMLTSELWAAMEPELLVTVRAELEPTSETEKQQQEGVETGMVEEKEIAQLLRVNKYSFLHTNKNKLHFLSIYFFLYQNLPPTPQKEKEAEKEGEDSELKKQEMLVQYLRDTETFALLVERAISIINTMLYLKTTSVVLEAVQFCVTVCEFSVADSLSGVRKMLPLVWSADAAIKDAVVQAYRRLYLNPQGDTTRVKAQTLVDSLSELMVDASLGTIQCLEEIVSYIFFITLTKPAFTSLSMNCVCLAQLLALCGCVAFWQVSHLERSVSTELRRRRGEKEEREEKEKGPSNKTKSAVEEELGLIGASAEDTEAELIRKICETELLAEENLLSAFLPLLVKVCSSPGRYSHPQLTTAACLALSQYMMISPSVCEDHIRLLFTVLERSTLPVVRANAIIALGDLTVRFPNILEPWTQNLYARLSDEVPSVRQTAVTVLTQLVLKDVLKVKGQVSEVAVLLIDPQPHITSLALNFFNELATKDNAIYNLLPDIISRLSDPDRGMSAEDFNTIMKQLFSYITKERQTESLVEKLCQRFRTAKTERQWCDLAVSLSLLSMCERGLKRLQECWECYSDKLTEPGVYQPLLSITAKLRRGAKPQLKAQVDEFEKRLTAVHTRGLENVESPEMEEESQKGGESSEKTVLHTPLPTRGRNRSKRDFICFCCFQSDAVMAESETPKVTTPIARTSRRARLRH